MLDKLRERLDQGIPEGTLNSLPESCFWKRVLPAAFISPSALKQYLSFTAPRGVVFCGKAGNGRHTAAFALMNSLPGSYLWLFGSELDQENPEETIKILMDACQLLPEAKGQKLSILLDGLEQSRHSMQIQDRLARVLDSRAGATLRLVIVTEKESDISRTLRRRLLMCPCAPPTKAERRAWLMESLENPIPIRIEGINLDVLLNKTEGFSWQQLHDFVDYMKLHIMTQVIEVQKAQKEAGETPTPVKKALESAAFTLSRDEAEVLLKQMEGQSERPFAMTMPVMQAAVGGTAEAPVSSIDAELVGKSDQEIKEYADKLKHPENMSLAELRNLD